MDFTFYNRILYSTSYAFPIIVYGFISIIILSIFGRWLIKNRTVWQYIFGSIWVIYWGFIAAVFTIIGRARSGEPQIELRLFWCIREAWSNHDAEDWYLVVGNILLFVPLGVIVAAFFKRMRAWWKVVLIGFGASLFIEVTQLVLRCGLFELDDLFNNTLGCFLGYCAWVIGACCISGDVRRDRRSMCVAAVVAWLGIVGFCMVAVVMGQPVFEWVVRG